MKDAYYELDEQIVHLPAKPKTGKKQRQLSQKERLAKPVCLKFS